MVNQDADGYTKALYIAGKYAKKRKKTTTYWKPNEC